MVSLSERDMARYQRQILIPAFGTRAQKRLKGASVLVAGAGGLGSSLLSCLAVAGIGRITVVDHDRVELSNLNRQVLHGDSDVGRSKVESAEERLAQMNPDVEVRGVFEKVTSDSAVRLARGHDAIVDCMDNFRARYALNDAALELGVPLFHAACYGFEGRVTTVIPGKTACLRCVMPKSPKEGACPVLGSTTGIIGSIQAAEVIKYFARAGELLAGRMLVFDSLLSRCEVAELVRNPGCESCGSFRGGR